MSNAFAAGDYKLALKLSQKLDKQILSRYSNIWKLIKTITREKNMQQERFNVQLLTP